MSKCRRSSKEKKRIKRKRRLKDEINQKGGKK